MKKNVLLILIIHIVFQYSAYTQEVPIPVPPSMQEFLKYGEVPVSEYTGIPNIYIPIYTVSVDGFQLPLQLTYHSSGNRVSDEASWVGLGWDLQLGSVMQIINDEDDFKDIERRQPDFQSTPPLENYYPYRYKYGTLVPTADGPYWTPTTPLTTPSASNGYKIATDYYLPVNGNFDMQENRMLGEGFVDSEPDIFTAQFLGHSIKFVTDFKTGPQSRALKVLNEKGYKIRINDIVDPSVPSTTPLFNWEIITPDGVTYYFEQKSGYISQSSTQIYDSTLSPNKNSLGGGSTNPYSRKQWYLSKIKTINNRIITINYLEKDNISVSTFSQTWRKIEQQSTHNADQLNNVKGTTSGNDLVSFTSNATTTQKRFYISSIEFPNGEVSFETSSRLDSNNSERLDKIAIYNDVNLIKEFTLGYDYFSSNTSDVANNIFSTYNATTNEKSLRLKLTSFQENGKNPYIFKYNNINLPFKNSFSIDYWGYYNGGHTNTSFIPNPSRLKRVDLGDNGNNHSANITYAKAGILEEITYPTKGKSIFEYELNEFDNYWLPNYSNINNITVQGLGLRIKSVTNKGIGDDILTKKEYRYYGGKSLQRKVFFKSYYTTLISSSFAGSWNYSIQQISSDGNYSSSLLNPISGIGYDKVEIENIDVNNSLKNGYRIATFTNIPEQLSIVHAKFSALPGLTSRTHYVNGSVLSQEYKNWEGNTIKKEDYSYEIQLSPLLYGARISFYGLALFSAVLNGSNTYHSIAQHLVSFYPLYADKTLLTGITTTNYFNSQAVSTTASIAYNVNNIKTSEKLISNGNILQEKRYAYSNASLYNQNRLTTPSTISTYKNGKFDFIDRFMHKNENDLVVLDERRIEFKPDVSSRRVISKYNKYDTKGNPLDISTGSDFHTVYIWGYNSEYPIAKIENATFIENKPNTITTAQKALITNAENASDLDNDRTVDVINSNGSIVKVGKEGDLREALRSLRNSLPKAMVTTYSYDPLIGVTSITDPRGYTIYYEYDVLNRLEFVKDAQGNLVSENKYHYKNQ